MIQNLDTRPKKLVPKMRQGRCFWRGALYQKLKSQIWGEILPSSVLQLTLLGRKHRVEEVNGGEKVSLPYRPWNKILQRYRFFSTLSRKLCASPWVSKGRVGALHTEVDLYAPIVPRMFWGTTLHEIHAEDCTTFPAQHQARRKGWFWCRPKIGSCAPPP